MNSKKRNAIETQFTEWIKSITVSKLLFKTPQYYQYGVHSKKGHYVLSLDEPTFESLISQLSQIFPTVASKTTSRVLQDEIGEIFQAHIDNQNSDEESDITLWGIMGKIGISACLEKVIKELGSLIRTHTFFVPIEGINLLIESQELQIGEFILYGTQSGPIMANLETPRDKNFAKHFKNLFDLAGCYVEIKEINGEIEFARQYAMEKSMELVHILNFLVGSCRKRTEGWHKINVIGQPAYLRDEIVVRTTNKETGYNLSKLAVFKHKIDDNMLELWKKYGVEKVAKWFAANKSDSKSIDAKLKRTVVWCSHAVNADIPEIQFVSLTTALESLLLGEGESKNLELNTGSITQRLADRVAYLLGNSYENRLKLSQRTKKLYGLRSGIVHGGTSLGDEGLLFEMEDIVYSSINAIAKLEIASWKEFTDWETQQRYSVPS